MNDLVEEIIKRIKTRDEGRKTLGESEEASSDAGIIPGEDTCGCLAQWKNSENEFTSVLKEKCEILRENIHNLNINYAINSNPTIESFGGVSGKFKSFFKRLVLKCIKWYVEPLYKQQTIFNENTISALTQSIKIFEELQVLAIQERLDAIDRFDSNIASELSRRFDVAEKEFTEVKDFTYTVHARYEDYQRDLENENLRLKSIIDELQNNLNELVNSIRGTT